MRFGKLLGLVSVTAAAAVVLAAPSYADDDTDFANQLHTYGIYGPRDYNAWLGKIACDRLHKRVDGNAFESTRFVAANLPRGATQAQAWQFFATAISYYCPDQTPVPQNVPAQSR